MRRQLAPFQWSFVPGHSGVTPRYLQFYGFDRIFLGAPGVKLRVGTVSGPAGKLAVYGFHRAGERRGTVWLAHGYFDHVGLYTHLIANLCQQGFDVVAFDLPGHGLSEGDPVSINDFADYRRAFGCVFAALAESASTPHVAIGQSTGAAILLDTLFNDPEAWPFQHLVTLAPLIRPAHWLTARVMHSVLAPWFRTWPRARRRGSSDEVFNAFIHDLDPLQSRVLSSRWVTALRRWIPTMEKQEPLPRIQSTVIQGRLDQTVDWRHNTQVLSRLLPRGEILFIPAAHHHLVNEAQEIRGRIFSHIEYRLKDVQEAP